MFIFILYYENTQLIYMKFQIYALRYRKNFISFHADRKTST